MEKVSRLISYNMHGFRQGMHFLPELCSKADVICLQEHWLGSDEFYMLNVDENFTTYASSAIDKITSRAVLKGRPFGGVAILVRNDLVSNTEVIYSHERFIIIKIFDTVICNVYLPCKGSRIGDLDYNDIIYLISQTLSGYSMHKLIIGGDLNTNLSGSSQAAQAIGQLMQSFKLSRTDHFMDANDKITFCNAQATASSLIDYFLISSHLTSSVVGLQTLDNGSNFSDHLPVCLSINNLLDDSRAIFTTESVELKTDHICKTTHYTWRWDKANKDKYRLLSFDYLQAIDVSPLFNLQITHTNMTTFIESLYDDIIKALDDAAVLSVPRKKGNFYKQWWDIELDEAKERSIGAHKAWRDCGKPQQGLIHEQMKKAKYEYKTLIRLKEQEGKKHFSDELNDALINKNQECFWKSWNNKLGGGKKAQIIAGCTDEKSITSKFAAYFQVTNNVLTESKDEDFKSRFNQRFNEYNVHALNFVLTNGDIARLLTNMKLGKAAGSDGILVEHLVYCHPIILDLLTILFNLCLAYCYIPKRFTEGIIVPILKGSNVDATKLENYRGITLCSVLSKLFEICILNLYGDYLKSDELQFGFKKKTGCSDAIAAASSAINHFVDRGSTISACLLDLSKAFDKVNHHGLFLTLMDRHTPKEFILMLKLWYTNCSAQIRWGNALSASFKVMAGVRQGGVLSPILFAVYIDFLITELKKSKFGVKVFGHYMGCILYADDILLIASSRAEMQKMLVICVQCMEKLDMKFNADKSMCIRFGKRFAKPYQALTLGQEELKNVSDARYLGVTFKAGVCLRFDFCKVKNGFYKAFNKILHKCNFASSELICLFLIQKMCIPILTYAYEVITLTKSDLCKLENIVNYCVKRIFCVTDNLNVQTIRLATGIMELKDVCKRRRIQFLIKLSRKDFTFREFIIRAYVMSNDWLNPISGRISYLCDINDVLREICAMRDSLMLS
jgi:exonuclease III